MKKLISIIAILAMILSYSVVADAVQTGNVFSDVDFSTTVGKDIQKLYNSGVINGCGDGTFKPEKAVTRAELCKMVNKVCKFTAIADVNFTDVTPDKWYYTQVLIGKQAGYINGMPDGTFHGEDYVTREQVCAIICRAFGIYDLGLSAGVTDYVSDWALTYVNTLITNKLINLESGNTFRATQPMTRGELSTVLAKFVVDTPVVTPPSTGGSTGGGRPGGSTGGNRPGGNTGGNTTPSNPTPENPTPENPTPENPTPENPTPENPTPENPTPENPTPENPTPENPTPENPTPENPTPENPTPENPTPENPTPDKPEEPEGMTKAEIIAANEEVLIYFNDVYNDLDAAIDGIESDTTYEIMSIVMSCLERAIAVGESGEVVITKNFINTEYKSDISRAKSIYYALGETAQGKVLDDIDKTVKKPSTKEYLMDMFL